MNKRDVWIVAIQGYPGTHFATFSRRLITPCILAGTSEYGCCAVCGRPYERVVTKSTPVADWHRGEYPPGQTPQSANRDRSFDWSRNGKPGSGSTLDGEVARKETMGWRKTCGCQTDDTAPCVVLDPFVGSGTTVATALELGRHSAGIDLSEKYLRENAVPRIEAAMRGEKPRRPAPAVVSDVFVPPQRMR